MSRCVAILGGTFDPIHQGHLALAEHFIRLLQPDELRVIPAGNPWQKEGRLAPAEHRAEMARLAFEERKIPVTLDRREIERTGPTYTVDSLRELRAELGSETSLVLLLGADQLLRLDTWKDWQDLFRYAHLCAATRPGYGHEVSRLPMVVAEAFLRRHGALAQIRSTPSGLCHLSTELADETSSTVIRDMLRSGKRPLTGLPPTVLDYIDKFHLYED